MAKGGHKVTPSTKAKLRKAAAALVDNWKPIQAALGQARVTDLNDVLGTYHTDQERFERELYDKADLLLREIAPPPRQTNPSKRRWRRDEIKPVVCKMFPGDVPKDKPTVELVQQLGTELKRRGMRDASIATMERALGRRR